VCCDGAFCIFRSDVADLRAQISLANTIGENERAEWLNKVLILDNKTVAVDNQGPYSPQDYLSKGKTLEHSSSSSHNCHMIEDFLALYEPTVLLSCLLPEQMPSVHIE
jgi:hypothetical protein